MFAWMLCTLPIQFFWGEGGGLGGAGSEEMQKIAKLTIFAIHRCQCFDVMVKEFQLNKITTYRNNNKRLTAVDVYP